MIVKDKSYPTQEFSNPMDMFKYLVDAEGKGSSVRKEFDHMVTSRTKAKLQKENASSVIKIDSVMLDSGWDNVVGDGKFERTIEYGDGRIEKDTVEHSYPD